MGIDGLLLLLRPIQRKEHISSFKNQRLAVDALTWLYKGCYGAATEKYTSNQQNNVNKQNNINQQSNQSLLKKVNIQQKQNKQTEQVQKQTVKITTNSQNYQEIEDNVQCKQRLRLIQNNCQQIIQKQIEKSPIKNSNSDNINELQNNISNINNENTEVNNNINKYINSINTATNEYLSYMFQMIDLLLLYDITPVMVFDGRTIPSKNATLAKRRNTKQKYRQKSLQLIQQGLFYQGKKMMARCINITEEIISNCIAALREKKIQVLIAPYEADCQIAKLKQLKLIDGAINEDSDLVIYGVNTVFKLMSNGECDYIDLKQYDAISNNISINNTPLNGTKVEVTPSNNTTLSNNPSFSQKSLFEYHPYPANLFPYYPQPLRTFLSLTPLQRLWAAILSGTDYNQNIHGIGLRTSINLINEHKTLHCALTFLQSKHPIPLNYLQTLLNTQSIFLHATVYNPIQHRLEPLTPFQSTQGIDFQLMGEHYPYNQEIARGDIVNKTMQKRDWTNTLTQVSRRILNRERIVMYEKIREQKNKLWSEYWQNQAQNNVKKLIQDSQNNINNVNNNVKIVNTKKVISVETKQINKINKTNIRINFINMMQKNLPQKIDDFFQQDTQQYQNNERHQKEIEDKIGLQQNQKQFNEEFEQYFKRLNPKQ